MDLTTVIFYLFVVVTLVSAGIVVTSRNIVRSAFALLFTLMGIAAMYAFLMADFLAITQVMVYVGGILILIVFGVMLTNRQISVDIKSGVIQVFPAVIVTGVLCGWLLSIISSAQWPVLPEVAEASATAPMIGHMFLSSYLLPFEIASVVLLVALVGAAMIARREKNA